MSDWTNFANGTWGDAARWTGGVPDAAGATANFTATSAGGALAIVSFAQNSDFTVGTLNIVTNANDSYIFRGQVDATLATLRFAGAGGSPAFLNVDTNGSSSEINNLFGLRIALDSDLIISTANTDTEFTISAPIIGARDIYKFGTGTLKLSADNSQWTGDLLLRGGRTEIVNNAAEGGGVVELDNGAALVGTANFNFSSAIETRTGNSSGVIAAETGTTMQLLGKVSLRSDASGAITFGSAADQGTITIGTSSGSIVTGAGGFLIAGGTVQFGGSNSAVVNFFNSLSSTGFLEIATGGTLDTRGVGANITNLDLDGGTIRSSLDGLSLFITDTTSGGNAQSGTIIGTANFDGITVIVTTNFSFSATTFSSWTNGTDLITLFGNNGDNDITGSTQNDTIDGGGGNDSLDGGAGADSMSGGAGDDTYVVDNAADQISEAGGSGTDTVRAGISYVLGSGLENLFLTGTAAIAGTGNSANNIITGNIGNNFLSGGGGGADTLNGGAGDDVIIVDADDQVIETAGGGNDLVAALTSYALNAGAQVETLSTTNGGNNAAIALTGNEFAQLIIGNAGSNFLMGGGGADTLNGGAGDDVIIVDADDQVIEAVGGGNDLVAAMTSYALNAGAQVETLSTVNSGSNAAIALTGNEFAQLIIGNAGNNFLMGGGAADTLQGLGGNDTYIVDSDDQVIEAAGGGNDLVAAMTSYGLTGGAQVETLSTVNGGSNTAINLTGNEFGQQLTGNAGNNILNGGLGADTLTGLGGADTFAFTTALGGGNVDAITDFQTALDKIALDDAIFSGIGGPGAFNAGAFAVGAAAVDADDRIIYNSATGQLFFDADGNGAGAAVLFATLNAGTALVASDFSVI
jgi:Ca2+-binding RTX toxin-like protein